MSTNVGAVQAKLLTNKSGTVRELTSKDMSSMKQAKDILPKSVLAVLPKKKRGERGEQKEPKKVSLTLRYSPEVIEYFKSTGKGWQGRMDDTLKMIVKKNSPKV